MKIAISSKGKDLESQVDEIFGRCPYFVIAEVEGTMLLKTEVIENPSVQKSGSVGISVAQNLVGKGVTAVISGNIGPRAMDVLKQFSVKVYCEKGTVMEVLNKFLAGGLKSAV